MLLFFNTAFATSYISNNKQEDLRKRAAIFLSQKSDFAQTFSNTLELRDSCNPPGPTGECVEFVAGTYPSSDQKLTAARSCVGVTSVDCVKFIAGTYPSFDQRVAAAQACRNNTNLDCAEFVAGMYPSFDQRIQAGVACKNADVSCVKSVVGLYPSFDQRINAAKACGGN